MHPEAKAVAVIPARGGSKRLPRKNLRCVGGVPLVLRAVEACYESPDQIVKVLVSTDDSEIKRMVEIAGAVPIDRPDQFSGDKARIDDTVRHALRTYYRDAQDVPPYTLILQPNIPIWEKGMLARIVRRFEAGDVTGIVTVHPVRERPEWMMVARADGLLTHWMGEGDVHHDSQSCRQDIYHLDGQVVACESARLMSDFDRRYLGVCGEAILPWVHDAPYTIDVDDHWDLMAADAAAIFIQDQEGHENE